MKRTYKKKLDAPKYWLVKLEHVQKLYNLFRYRFGKIGVQYVLSLKLGYSDGDKIFDSYEEFKNFVSSESFSSNELFELGLSAHIGLEVNSWVTVDFRFSQAYLMISASESDGSLEDWVHGFEKEARALFEKFLPPDQLNSILEKMDRSSIATSVIKEDFLGTFESKLLDELEVKTSKAGIVKVQTAGMGATISPKKRIFSKTIGNYLLVSIIPALIGGGYLFKERSQENVQNISSNQGANSEIKQISQTIYGDGNNIIAENINIQESPMRALTDLETGKSILFMAPGTYFFVDPIDLSVYYSDHLDSIDAWAIQRDRYYEAQRDISGALYFLGYVSEESYSNLSNINTQDLSFALFNNSDNDHNKVVAIPLTTIKTIHGRWIDLVALKERTFILDLTINGKIRFDRVLHDAK